jgi:hypothetical protein
MYAVTFMMLTFRSSSDQAPFAMVLGHVFCMVCLLGEFLVPMPTAKTVRIGSTTIPFLDPIPAVFGFLFLLGFLCSSSAPSTKNGDKSASSRNNISHVCKVWTMMYVALVTANTVPTILMEPSNLYIHELGRTFTHQTSNSVQLIMMRVGWIVCATQLLMAVAMVLGKHQLVHFPLVYYLIHMLYVQLHYPWHPYSSQLIPLLSKDGVLLMPPWMMCAGTVIGSLVSLHAQKELDVAEKGRKQTNAAAVEQQSSASTAEKED